MFRLAEKEDFFFLVTRDHWVSSEELKYVIDRGRIWVVELEGKLIGWLRYGLFWDEIPFVNMLRLEEMYRKKGIGTQLIGHWEKEMRQKGFSVVMTSTSSAEGAQHFYRKLGYHETGGFLPQGEPFELIFVKRLIEYDK